MGWTSNLVYERVFSGDAPMRYNQPGVLLSDELGQIWLPGPSGRYVLPQMPAVPISYFGLGPTVAGRIDITNALAKVQQYVDGIAADADANLPLRASNKPRIYFPSGTYTAQGNYVFTTRDVALLGDGRNRSVLYYDSITDLPMFDFGAFSATPSPTVFLGPQGASIQGLGFNCSRNSSTGAAAIGNRTGQAVRASGGGELYLEDVRASGFKYGFNVPYGGDFNSLRRVRAEHCDVGVYHGPGAQQVGMYDVDVAFCREGIVFDRVAHGTIVNLNAGSSKKSCVVFEALPTGTRQLTSFPASGTSIQSNLRFINTYLESNAVGLATSDFQVPDQLIEVNCTAADAIRGIKFDGIRAFCNVSTTPAKTCGALIGATGGGGLAQHITLADVVFAGTITQMGAGSLGAFVQVLGWRTENGYTQPAYGTLPHFQDTWGGLDMYATALPTHPARRGTTVRNSNAATGGTVPAFWINVTGGTTWAPGPNTP